MAGDFILSAASMALARIGDNTVVKVLSQVIEDLVRGTAILLFMPFLPCLYLSCTKLTVSTHNPLIFANSLICLLRSPGEFMQLGSKENENERFKHYLEKTFKKTASLIANSCKAVCTFCLHTNITESEEILGFYT